MSRVVLLTIACAFALFSQSSAVFAEPCKGCGGGVADAFKGTIDILYPQYETSRDNLRSRAPEDWSNDEITSYLETSLTLIYHAFNLNLLETGSHPLNPTSICSTSYLPEWPLNPFTWQPIVVRDCSEGFFAGDVAFQLCPMSYSIRGKQRSFELSIFGPALDWVQSPKILSSNSGWAITPAGTVMSIGFTTETDSERSARLARKQELQEKSDAQK